jgi:hypothetical protein
MKKILSIIFAAALVLQAANVIAQDEGDSSEPTEKSVLQKAREKYGSAPKAKEAAPAGTASAETAEATPAEEKREAEDQPADGQARGGRYTPIQLSLVPGLAFPRGAYDTSLALGAVGSSSDRVSGIQGAGVFSIARELRGVQGAGVFNITRENLQGAQGAGVFNIANEVRGAQLSGVFNIAKNVHGVQAAGVFNAAEQVDGVQVGLVNVAKSMDGVQIGLFSYVANGIHELGLAYEPQSGFAYASWQSGSKNFYTRWGYGATGKDWKVDFDDAVASFGIGSRNSISIVDFDIDLSAECAVRSFSFDLKKVKGRHWDCDDEDDKDFRDREEEIHDDYYYVPDSWPRIYPSLRIEANIPLGRHVKLFGGLKADIDIDALGDRVPEALKCGAGWKGEVWGGEFTVWPKWFIGLKI